MKSIKFYVLSILCFSIFFVSCESAKEEEWGNSLLYMPQSVLGSGGQNANLKIDVYASSKSDTSIVVGIYRSGLEPIKSVTADLVIAVDTLASAINLGNTTTDDNYQDFKGAKLLPSDYYELPNSISLSNGQRENHVFLKLNKSKLFADSHIGTFILPVKLENPTRYKLNEKRSLTFFIFSKK